jgi:hypothetical protein
MGEKVHPCGCYFVKWTEMAKMKQVLQLLWGIGSTFVM